MFSSSFTTTSFFLCPSFPTPHLRVSTQGVVVCGSETQLLCNVVTVFLTTFGGLADWIKIHPNMHYECIYSCTFIYMYIRPCQDQLGTEIKVQAESSQTRTNPTLNDAIKLAFRCTKKLSINSSKRPFPIKHPTETKSPCFLVVLYILQVHLCIN